jgi:uridine kinase
MNFRTPLIQDVLVDYVRSASREIKHYNVVIGGPAAIGKSQLAIALCDKLQGSTYLPLDSSVLGTIERDQTKLNGCQIQSYDLSIVRRWLKQLENEESFLVSPFDHATRKCVGSIPVDGRCRVRIIEWVFALSKDIGLRRDLIIVLDANEKARYNYWYERFTDTRKETLTDSALEAIRQRFNSTREQIDPTLESFGIRFSLDETRRIQRIDCNVPELNRLLQARL